MSALRHAELDVHDEHLRLGYRCGNCAACYPEAAASWHDDARAGQLRPAVVGGVPIDTTSHPDFSQGAGCEASPRSSSRALRGAALATQPA